ncbi:hypothetical protein FQR65_LT19004 [Abscondita terminalis]|nr:hypothetical protein FQR65_LT19004 [Abscondita terminalis]
MNYYTLSDASKSDQLFSASVTETITEKLKQKSNGDAYDRTGDVFIIPQERAISYYTGLTQGVKSLPVYQNGNGKSYQGVALTPDYLPFIELMRFFTPFGIGHFNEKIQLKGKNWHNNTPYRQDITELRPQLTLHPGQQKIVNNNFVLPVFNTTNVMEMAGQDYPTMFNSDKGVEVEFTLTKDLKNAQLRYITTGHGGWGAGDEFVPKENSIYLDGKLAHAFTPWRTDCGSYRLFNPASDPTSGKQPLFSKDGNLVLAVNGEIYNHLELRKEFPEYEFMTQSDCEVILALYQKYGKNFLEKLNGIFAFALYDIEKGTYLISRDHIGIILYTKLKSLEGICNKIEEFKPGHLLYSADGEEYQQWYTREWEIFDAVKNNETNIAALRKGLEEAVHRQLMSDVPYGVLLSGGLDSTIIAAVNSKFASKRIESGDTQEAWYPRLHSFAVGLEGSPDLAAARKAADCI